ncbi:PucR family transcriptional regulator [Deinococcus yavapaiensis]|uniref:Carbohydrate diacid regulator n=1 Tax=Deinococcus yavapaiensis KR-236 TaxID=694435 RepID=A0A318S352_9DEIO|nr:helix-turn-helix domain-containing protein [Deinococcus yavapaiensis]PYE52931.1 carbohydrate diacid regulator [Deinococcus yavapaiensis KR-236]
MHPPSPPFERIAREISRRAAELLSAPTTVLDAQGGVVASSDDASSTVAHESTLRVPFRVADRHGHVVVGEGTGEEIISPRLARSVVELLVNQARAREDFPHGPELKDKLLHDLLLGEAVSEDSSTARARLLGMDLAPPRAVLLVDAAEFILGSNGEDDARSRRRADLVIGSVAGFFRLPLDTICTYLGRGEVAVLKASDSRNLETWAEDDEARTPSWSNLAALKRAATQLLEQLQVDTGRHVTIGLGRYHRGLRGLARSHQDAQAALSLGRRLHGDGRVYSLDALGVAAFLGVPDERIKLDLARHLLTPLDAEAELLFTLDVFFQHDCHPLPTAKALGIHRNTLSYRLDKTQLLTGLDPRHFDHAVQIRLAMLLRDFAR